MIPVADPRAGYVARKQEIDAAVLSVLQGGWYILGNEVKSFEREFAEYVGVQFGVGVATGTDALQLAIRSCGIGPGDAVVTVSHTAVATAAAIDLAGALPVLVDIDPATFTIDPDRLGDTLRDRRELNIKAIIPVHLYGHPADMASIMELAGKFDLYVIEDGAQSHGAMTNGRMAGSVGQLAGFSFYPTKNLGAFGDGGAVVTNDSMLREKLVSLRQYGWRERYVSSEAGLNSRLDEIQAAVLRVKLRHLDSDNSRRRQIARLYSEALQDTTFELPVEKDGSRHVYHQYVVRTERRDELAAYLRSNAVGTGILYPVPIHLQPGYRNRVVPGEGGLGVTERICRRILSLPMYPELTDAHVSRVIELLKGWKI